jgi:predicted nucleotidyltransferase
MSYRLSTFADAVQIELLTVLARLAEETEVPWIVVGAFARDAWLHIYEIPISRSTVDIDIVVQVPDWKSYRNIRDRLLAHPLIDADPKGVVHRLTYKNTLPLDLLPVGEIAQDGEIAWPPDGNPTMDVIGIEDVPTTLMLLPDETPIRICDLVGLVYLKLLAWHDTPSRSRDLEDIYLIMRHYIDAGNESRLDDRDRDLLDVDDFDYDLANAALLGRDLVAAMSPHLIRHILPILADLTKPANWMGAAIDDHDPDHRRTGERASRMIQAMIAELQTAT